MTNEAPCGEDARIYRRMARGPMCHTGEHSAPSVLLKEGGLCLPVVLAKNHRGGALPLIQTLAVGLADCIVQIDQRFSDEGDRGAWTTSQDLRPRLDKVRRGFGVGDIRKSARFNND